MQHQQLKMLILSQMFEGTKIMRFLSGVRCVGSLSSNKNVVALDYADSHMTWESLSSH